MPMAVPPVCCHAARRQLACEADMATPFRVQHERTSAPPPRVAAPRPFHAKPGARRGNPAPDLRTCVRLPTFKRTRNATNGTQTGFWPPCHRLYYDACTSIREDLSGKRRGRFGQRGHNTGRGAPLTRTEPPRVPGSPIHLMRSPHRARRPPPATGGRSRVGKKIQRTFAGSSKRTGGPPARRGGPDRIRSGTGLLVPPCEIVGPGAGPRRGSRAELSPCLRPPR